jgi:tetratricopeptide (TPR) repeat protein
MKTFRTTRVATVSAVLLAGSQAMAQQSPPPPGASPPTAPPAAAGAPPRGREAVKPETKDDALKRLYGELATAPDATAADKVVRQIEVVWAQSASPTATLLLNRALKAAGEKNYDLSLQFLDTVTELFPDWPEGFNRRAYLYVVKLEYGRALGDLRRVLALDPGNFRALEGLVQVLRTMGQDKAALDVVRTLVKAHPYSPGAQDMLKELEEAVDGRGI